MASVTTGSAKMNINVELFINETAEGVVAEGDVPGVREPLAVVPHEAGRILRRGCPGPVLHGRRAR